MSARDRDLRAAEDRAFAYSVAINAAVERGKRRMALGLAKRMIADIFASGIDLDHLAERLIDFYAGDGESAEAGDDASETR